MKPEQKTPQAESVNYLWDGSSLGERVQMILDYAEHFIEAGLLKPMELVAAVQLSESEVEYQVEQGRQAIFEKLDLKKGVMQQRVWRKLRNILEDISN